MNNRGDIYSGAATFTVYAVCANRPKSYVIVSGGTFVFPNEQGSAWANCQANTQLLGGGVDGVFDGSDLAVNINSSSLFTGWYLAVNNGGVRRSAPEAYSICGIEKSVTFAIGPVVDEPAGSQTNSTALCPGTTVPFSGGVSAGDNGDLAENMDASYPVAGGWAGSENNAGTQDHSMYVFNLCGS